ncbi:GIY-YIG nuclease family protein [Clostridium estertheticum]|uniref:GIY-YIG nuclease family protein n=1 Tax=Clostridium estertheticum TaxID=238834 RepID=UPI00124CBA82|nr:GIY-YIG nuclease family protein [Clostridium estertheticum]MBZ9616785.1 GIY-YIG nuclease family protein [Clostridium estertheticum subsp. laramiense]WAG72492.1 GIY-YIG nuclease family protein [Clostridium estertheticum]
MKRINYEYMKERGIYKITNKINGRFYIGKTKRPFHRRKSEHFCRLKKGEHESSVLQKDWDTVGHERKNYTFEIIEVIHDDDINKIVEREKYYIEKYINDAKCLNSNH